MKGKTINGKNKGGRRGVKRWRLSFSGTLVGGEREAEICGAKKKERQVERGY